MAVEILEQTITYDGQARAVNQNHAAGGVIGDYMVRCYYERDECSYAGALTSPTGFAGSDVGVVRLGRPVVVWIVEWTACKLGNEPPVPHPDPPAGWRRLDAHLTPAQIVIGPDGDTPVYRISGVYVYVKLKASASPIGDARFPLAPWLLDGVFRRQLPASKLSSVIAGTGGAGGLDNPVQVRFKAGG